MKRLFVLLFAAVLIFTPLSFAADTSSGAKIYTGAVTGVVNIITRPGRVLTIDAINTTGAVAYLQVFNATAANVTLGTTTPAYSIGLAASGVKTILIEPFGIDHDTAISVAGTTTRTGGTTAQIDVNIVYL